MPKRILLDTMVMSRTQWTIRAVAFSLIFGVQGFFRPPSIGIITRRDVVTSAKLGLRRFSAQTLPTRSCKTTTMTATTEVKCLTTYRSYSYHRMNCHLQGKMTRPGGHQVSSFLARSVIMFRFARVHVTRSQRDDHYETPHKLDSLRWHMPETFLEIA